MKSIWIDDDEYRTQNLIDLLDLYDIQVDFYTSYVDALSKIKDNCNKIDFLIIDIMMPYGDLFSAKETNNGKKTGIVLYEKIRSYYKGPIIIYTVLSDNKLFEPLIELDNKLAYLPKPSSINIIIESINKLLGNINT